MASNPLRSCYFCFDDSPTWHGLTDDTYWNGSLKICHVDAATHAEITAHFRPEACPANAENLAEFEAELKEITAEDGSADYSQQGWTTSESSAPRYWARVLGLAYHPDTRGADYYHDDETPALTPNEAARYDQDHEDFDGDAYAEGMDEWVHLGLIPADEAAHHAAESAIMAAAAAAVPAGWTEIEGGAEFPDRLVCGLLDPAIA